MTPGLQDPGSDFERGVPGGRPVDPLGAGRRERRFVDRLAEDIEQPSEDLRADRHGDRAAGVEDRGAAGQPVGRVQRDRAGDPFAEELRHLERQAP